MANIDIRVTADNRQATRALTDTQRQVARTADSIKKSGQSVDGFFTKMGRDFDQMKDNMVKGLKSLAVGVYGFQAMAAAGEGVKALISQSTELRKAMKEVSTISQEVTDDIDGYEQKLLELTARVPIGAVDAAKALYQIVSAGQQGADALNVLEVAAKTAIGGVTDTATAADTLTTLLNAYHLSARDAQKVSDMLFTTVRLGKTNMTELGHSIATVAPTAAAYGISMEDLLAAVASITKQGTPTAVAMTQLNAVITQAVNVLGDGAFQGRSFRDALAEIATKADGSMSALKADISNVRAMKAVLQMTGDSADMAAKDLAAMANAAGAADEAFGKMFDTQSAQRLRNNVQAYLQPIVEEANKTKADIRNALSDIMESGALKDYLAALEGIIAAYGVYRTAVIVTTALKSAEASAWTTATWAERKWYVQTLLAEKAQALLNKTMLANPYVAAVTAIGALTAALLVLEKRYDATRLAKERLDDAYTAEADAMQTLLDKMLALVDAATNEEASDEERAAAMEALNRRYSVLLQNYTDEEGHLTNIAELKERIAAAESDNALANARAEKSMYEENVALLKKLGSVIKEDWTDEEAEKMKQMQQRAYDQTGFWFYDVDKLQQYYETAAAKAGEHVQTVLAGQVASGTAGTSKPAGKPELTDEQKKAIKQANQDRAKLQEVQEQQQREQQRAVRDQELAVAQARIDAMAEGAAKEREQLALDYAREEEEIRREAEDLLVTRENAARQLWEAEHAAEIRDGLGAGWVGSSAQKAWRAGAGLTAADKAYFQAKHQANAAKYDQGSSQQTRAQREAMQEYLQQYGSMMQKRAAITEQYTEKMRTAETQGEANAAAAEMQQLLSQLDMEAISKAINWEAVFGSLDAISTDHLEQLREKLRAALDMNDITAENAKTITSQLQQIEDAIASRRNVWSQLFGGSELTGALNDRAARKRRAEEAAQLEAQARERVERQRSALNGSRASLYAQLQGRGYGGSLESVSGSNAQAIMNLMGDSGLQEAFAKLSAQESQLTISTEALREAEASSAVAAEAAGASLGGAMAMAGAAIDLVNTNVQSLVDLTQELGLEDTGFGQGIGSFAAGISAGADAYKAFMSGDVIGAIAGSLKALRNMGDALGQWGVAGFGSSDSKLLKDLEHLANSNEDLIRALDRLTKEMEDSTVAGAASVYKAQLEAQQSVVNNMREQMGRSGSAYSNGFLGIGGDKSSNAKINASMSSSDWARISKLAGTSVQSAAQFWNLSSEQMSKVATYGSDLWTRLKEAADDGYQDASTFMEDYITQWETLKQLQDAYNEKLTNVSFDGVKSEFAGLLTSMETTGQDWADSFEDMMRSAVINALMDDYSDALEAWYKNFAKAMEDGALNEAEADALRQQYNSIADDAEARRNEIYNALGIKDSSGGATSTVNAVQSVSEDTANDLVGRMTSMQMSCEAQRVLQETVSEQLSQALVRMSSQAELASEGNALLQQLRDIMTTGTGYLEELARMAKSSYSMLDDRLARILTNTNKL